MVLLFSIVSVSCEKDYTSSIIGEWESCDLAGGLCLRSNGVGYFWSEENGEYSTGDEFYWWLKGNILCTKEPEESDDLCDWTGNPNCICYQEGGRHVTTIIKLTETEMILNVDDDNAYDSDYDMPSKMTFKRRL